MGLITKGKVEINSTDKIVQVSDITGNYDADINPDGYGSPNLARSSRALFIQKYTVDSNEQQVVEVILGSDPITDTAWEISFTEDFVASIVLISLPVYSSDPTTSTLETGFTYYNSDSDTIRTFDGDSFADVAEVEYSFIGKKDSDSASEVSQKFDLSVLVLTTVNAFLKEYFINNVDSKSIQITNEDIVYLKALKNTANDDFINKNYLSSQNSIDEIKRVLKKLE